MKHIDKMGAQGDLFIRRIEALPEGVTEKVPENGQHVVAHSETGHNHFLKSDGVNVYDFKDPMVCYLTVGEAGAQLEHARPYDQHETIFLSGGTYELRRQREHTPEGWRRVED